MKSDPNSKSSSDNLKDASMRSLKTSSFHFEQRKCRAAVVPVSRLCKIICKASQGWLMEAGPLDQSSNRRLLPWLALLFTAARHFNCYSPGVCDNRVAASSSSTVCLMPYHENCIQSSLSHICQDCSSESCAQKDDGQSCPASACRATLT